MKKEIKTPIRDFVESYIERDVSRFHMPGHKGRGALGIEGYDITEIAGADSLYSPEGIIAESESIAGEIFGALTHYSTEGSSHAIRAMVYLTALLATKNGERCRILAGRNAHKTFLSALALVDAEVEWIPTSGVSYLSCGIDTEELRHILSGGGYTAVYVTTPDYLGGTLDVRAVADVAHSFGVPLLVDNAHGAYLKFLPESRHPIDLGADMCADSAHKTLPVLTGGAYLHISKSAPDLFSDRAVEALSLFGSTSPSYLTLVSLDAANAYIEDGYRARLAEFCSAVSAVKSKISLHGFTVVPTEPLKITIAPKSFGYSGSELADILRTSGIECEFSDPDYTVLMLTPSLDTRDLERLEASLASLEKKSAIIDTPPVIRASSPAISPRSAILSPSERVSAKDACGRILASLTVSCPPAVPIVALGEMVGETAIEAFRYYGIDEVTVIKES